MIVIGDGGCEYPEDPKCEFEYPVGVRGGSLPPPNAKQLKSGQMSKSHSCSEHAAYVLYGWSIDVAGLGLDDGKLKRDSGGHIDYDWGTSCWHVRRVCP